MGEYTNVEYAGVDSPRLFGKQLGLFARALRMPMPMFKGRKLQSYIPEDKRWEIHTLILGDPTAPNTEDLSYIGRYVSWERGVDIAMHEALSRLCYLHHQKLPQNSIFHEFGMRDRDGEAIVTPGNRNDMVTFEKHIEDLEIHAVHMEELLDMEMTENYKAKAVVQVQGLEIETLHTLRGTMEQTIAERDQTIVERDQTIVERDQTIAEKDALIAALQAQLNPPPDDDNGNDDDDDDDDDEDDDDDGNGDDDEDGGDEAEVNIEASEEEDPEERIFDLSSDEGSGEEYTPSSRITCGRKRKRKCMKASSYLKRFK